MKRKKYTYTHLNNVFHLRKKDRIPVFLEMVHFRGWIEHYSETSTNIEEVEDHYSPMAIRCASEVPERL